MSNAMQYLGDGVYAEFESDHIILRANGYSDALCTNKIYLEPTVLSRLNQFYTSRRNRNEQGTQAAGNLLDE